MGVNDADAEMKALMHHSSWQTDIGGNVGIIHQGNQKLTRNLKALGKLGTLATEIAWINLAFKLGDDKMMQRHPSQWSTESTENVGITYHGKGIQKVGWEHSRRRENYTEPLQHRAQLWRDWGHWSLINLQSHQNHDFSELFGGILLESCGKVSDIGQSWS